MKRSPDRLLGLCLAGILLLASCKQDIPSDVIPPERMEALLYDYHIAQAVGNDYNGEERYKKELLLQYVFQKHATTKAEFDSSLVWYTRHTEQLDKIYERVGERFKQAGSSLSDATEGEVLDKEAKPLSGDTVEIWNRLPLYRLSDADLTNRLSFTISTDTTYYPGDLFQWSIRVMPLGRSSIPRNAEMELGLRYENDSTASVHRRLTKGLNRLSLAADTLPLKEVRGMVYYGGDSLRGAAEPLLVHAISLTRYHTSQRDTLRTTSPLPKPSAEEFKEDTLRRMLPPDTLLPEKRPLRLTPREQREQNRPQRILPKIKPQPRPVPPPNRRGQSARTNRR